MSILNWIHMTAWLVGLIAFLLALRLHSLCRRSLRDASKPPIISRKRHVTTVEAAKRYRKPGWVITEVLRLLAITRGHAGCRSVAAMFNARFAFRGESVSKSFVAQLRNKNRYAIVQLRKQLRQPPRRSIPNQTWALDWTNVSIKTETHTLLGVIDHDSRKLLSLGFANKSASEVIQKLRQLIDIFGKPKALRTDNDGAFVSMGFALALRRLRIKHQRSAPHQPWQNGRIERFFGTFKRAIRQIEISSRAQLQQAVTEFAFFYNQIRLHQNIGNCTPNMAWLGQTQFPKRKTPQWFAAWDGVLCGWDWSDIEKAPDDWLAKPPPKHH